MLIIIIFCTGAAISGANSSLISYNRATSNFKHVTSSSWPIDNPAGIRSTPAVANVDADASGSMELVVGDMAGNLHVYHGNGSQYNGWPKDIGDNITSSPLLVNMDTDTDLEIVVGTGDGDIYSLNLDGSSTGSNWPVSTSGSIKSSLTAGDLDGDGDDEIIACSMDGSIYVLDLAGNAVSGFPLDLGSSISASPSLADIDGDNDLDIIVGTESGDLHAINEAAGEITGFPVSFGDSIESSPSVGNIDGISGEEIVVCDHSGNVTILNSNGTIYRDWTFATGSTIAASPVIADLNRDGNYEIYICTYNPVIYAFTHDNTLLWTQAMTTVTRSTPAVADIDKDGYLDLVYAGYDGMIYAWDRNGDPVFTPPVNIDSSGFIASPLIADLDGDNYLDIITSTENGKISITATASAGHAPWTRFKGNNHCTAFARDDDQDGLLDNEEQHYSTSSTTADSDNDQIPDGWEVANRLDPTNPGDASLDPDHDDLTNLQEYQQNKDPNTSDLDPGKVTAEEALFQQMVIIGSILVVLVVGSASFLILARKKGLIMKTGRYEEKDLRIADMKKDYEKEVARVMAEAEKTRIVTDILTPADDDIQFIDEFGVKDLEISYTYEIQRIIDRLEQTRKFLAYDIIIEQQQQIKNLKNKWLAEKDEVKISDEVKNEIETKLQEVIDAIPEYIRSQNETIISEISTRQEVLTRQFDELKSKTAKDLDTKDEKFLDNVITLSDEVQKTAKSIDVFTLKLGKGIEYLKQQSALTQETEVEASKWYKIAENLKGKYSSLSKDWEQKAIISVMKFLEEEYNRGLTEKDEFKNGLEAWLASGNIEETKNFINFSYTKTRTVFTDILANLDRLIEFNILQAGEYSDGMAKKTQIQLDEIEKFKNEKEKSMQE